jgi:hypothetical protein
MVKMPGPSCQEKLRPLGNDMECQTSEAKEYSLVRYYFPGEHYGILHFMATRFAQSTREQGSR